MPFWSLKSLAGDCMPREWVIFVKELVCLQLTSWSDLEENRLLPKPNLRRCIPALKNGEFAPGL